MKSHETLSAPIHAEFAWKGSSFDFEGRCLWTLTEPEVEEIRHAVKGILSRPNFDLPEITPANFPLPNVGPRLKEIRRGVGEGSGVALIRGLQQGHFSDDEMAVALVGLGSYVGEMLAQSHRGEVLGSIIDASDVEGKWRGYHMGGAQRFHTDGTPCDVQALMCVRAAKSGGASRIVSAAAIHNELLERRPDLLKVLYGDFFARRADVDSTHGTSVKHVSVFSQDDGAFSCYFTSGELRRAVSAGDTVFTPLQAEAIEEVQKIGSSPEFYLDMKLGEGDLQFLNNRTILHGRLTYEDYEEFARRRYMLRLSLLMPDWNPRPARQLHTTADDAHSWLRTRQRRADLPSAYLAALAASKQGAQAERR